MHSFAQFVREETPYDDIIPLLLVEFQPPEIAQHQSQSEASSEAPEFQMPDHDELANMTNEELGDLEDRMTQHVEAQSLYDMIRIDKLQARELIWIDNHLTSKDCVLANVPGDGNCLYHALSLAAIVFQFREPPYDHVSARNELVDYMERQNASWFELPDDLTLVEYLKQQRQPKQWGDENTVKAAAECYQRKVSVTSVNEGSRTFTFRSRPLTQRSSWFSFALTTTCSAAREQIGLVDANPMS